MADLRAKLRLDDSEYQKGINSAIKSAGKLAGALGLAFGTAELVRFGKEAFNISQRFRLVDQAFQRTGASLDDLRSATAGTISDFQLIQNTVRAVNFGIPVERLGAAFEFATKRAAETGESVQFLVDSIVTGIGRKSSLVLDNLGISAIAIQEEFKKTGDFAQAAFNLIEREGAKSTLAIEDAGTSTERFAAAWDNFKVSIGDLVEGPGSSLLNWLTEVVKETTNAVRQLSGTESIEDQINRIQESIAEGEKTLDNIFNNRANIDQAGVQYTIVAKKVEELRKELAALQAQQEGQKSFAATFDAPKVAEDLGVVTVQLREVGKALDDIQTRREKLSNAIQNAFGGFLSGAAGQELGQNPLDELPKKSKESFDKVRQQTLDLGNFLGSAFSTLGESLGDALSGTFDGSKFLQSLASFGEAFGKQLIAIGVASKALQDTIKNPLGSIAAGVALIAISRIIKNTASSANAALSSGNFGASSFNSLSSSGINSGGVSGLNFSLNINGRPLKEGYDYQIYRQSYTG